MFVLQNDDATANRNLYPLGGPFSRMRILPGGQIIRNIHSYHRLQEMFQVYSATDSRANDYAKGFGNFWQEKGYIQTA